jgi:uncharacterized membrane protein YphA (DoxX/SURF4 family)
VTLTGIGLLALRWVIGLVFIMHGGQKIFVKGLPAVGGGILLIAGAFTRFAALSLGVTMVVAIAGVLWTKGRWPSPAPAATRWTAGWVSRRSAPDAWLGVHWRR